MRYLIAFALLLVAHFTLTPFAPAAAGESKWFWPFAADSRPVLALVGGLPQQGGGIITPLLAGLGGLAALGAALALFGVLIPTAWWRPLTGVAAAASLMLYLAFFGRWAVLPIALDAVVLWLALAAPRLVLEA